MLVGQRRVGKSYLLKQIAAYVEAVLGGHVNIDAKDFFIKAYELEKKSALIEVRQTSYGVMVLESIRAAA